MRMEVSEWVRKRREGGGEGGRCRVRMECRSG